MLFFVSLVFVNSIRESEEEDQLVFPEDIPVFTVEKMTDFLDILDILDESASSEEELEFWSSAPSDPFNLVKDLAIFEKLSINLLQCQA